MKRILFVSFLLSFFLVTSCIFASGTVDINTASLAQLDTLTGIGPKYAQAIIDARPFSSIDELLRVKGIGPKTLQKIKDQGLACVNCLPAQQDSITAENTAVVNNTTPTTIPAIEPNGAMSKQPEEVLPPTYPTGVFINEILSNPEGSDETEEWIELYNSNAFEVDLSKWQIQDTTGSTTTFTIPRNTTISSSSFVVFKRPETKIMLNNDTDGLNLLTPDKKTIDSVNFSSAPLGQSYNKTNNGWQWSTNLTPGYRNIVTARSTTTNLKTLPKVKNSVTNDGVELGLASLTQINQDRTIKNPWFLFFVALTATTATAIIVLLIKLKIGGANQN